MCGNERESEGETQRGRQSIRQSVKHGTGKSLRLNKGQQGNKSCAPKKLA